MIVARPADRRDRRAQQARAADPRFTDEDLRLAETFAARAAVAVDLADRVARDALRRVVEGQELERRRLARELHDETGQALTSILLGLKRVEDADDEGGGGDGDAELRERDRRRRCRTSAGSPSSCARRRSTTSGSSRRSSGSAEAFGERVGHQGRRRGEPRRRRGCRPRSRPRSTGSSQEALTNVAKHAGAEHVSIVVTRRDGVGDRRRSRTTGAGFGAGGGERRRARAWSG